MSGGAPAQTSFATREEAEKFMMVRDLFKVSGMYGNIGFTKDASASIAEAKAKPTYQQDVDQIEKRIDEIDRQVVLKDKAGEGFQEIGKGDRSISTKGSGFQEIPGEAVARKDTSKKSSSNSLLDSQRAALGARRRQSLFSTSQSRSLLG